MINNKKVLAIIPARGGSKGIKRKNIKVLLDKPLLIWTVDVAIQSQYIDKLILSSDDIEIINIAKEYGVEVPFRRPSELAKDNTPGIDVILHAIDQCDGYDIVVVLQPTSPLRIVEDIDGAINKMIEAESSSCVTLCKSEKSPYWMYSINNNNILSPFLNDSVLYQNRQDLPEIYSLNGAVYVARIEWMKKHRSFIGNNTYGYIMPHIRSVDIDEELDFVLSESLLSSNINS